MSIEKPTEQPLVSIITVNYNQSEVTCQLISSLQKITYKNIEIIVVDNGSPNDNPEKIKIRFPEVIFIKSIDNLGFAGGNNLGIKVAKGEYYFFLNNDTEVPENFLEPLIEFLSTSTNAGVVSPQIQYFYHPGTIQYAGYSPMSKYSIRNSGIGYKEINKGQYNSITETNYAHGAAMLVPRKVIEQVGMMPEIYFLYYEEYDWCEMIKQKGYKIYYIPQSLVFHKESVSTQSDSPLKTYYLFRNRILWVRRNRKGIEKMMAMLYLLLVAFPKNYLSLISKGNWENSRELTNALIWNLRNKKN